MLLLEAHEDRRLDSTGHTNELLFEFLGQPSCTDFDLHPLAGGLFERFTVTRCGQIGYDHIAHGHVDTVFLGLEHGITLAQRSNGSVDVILFHTNDPQIGGKSLVRLEFEVRADVHHRFEPKTRLLVEFVLNQTRAADDVEPLLLDRIGACAFDQLGDDFFAHLIAEAHLEYPARHLALAEAGNADTPAEPLVCTLELALDVFGRNGHGQDTAHRTLLFDAGMKIDHGRVIP